MRVVSQIIVAALVLSCVSSAFAASGVRGRAAWRGVLIDGVSVKAYRSIADIALDKVVARSAPTDLDGIYQLDLEPGSYVLTASNAPGERKHSELKAGDLFCYYSGSPIQVTAKGYRNVGFNLIKVPEEASPAAAKRSGIYGELSFQDQPLERSYLYVYKDPSRGFKGPGYFIQPVAKGSFRLNLPPGDYYLLARKRERGGQFGPIEPGDYFNYYHGNPVRIKEKSSHEIKLETITRLSMLEEDVIDFHGVRGQIVDGAGKGQAGLHVFAYRESDMVGSPDHFSTPSDAEGRFELPLPDSGPYYLLARQAFGGPAGEQELYGKLCRPDGAAQALKLENESMEVKIHVAPQKTE
ncbi:MAG: carboxypeptidase-like regulatory domain-containing protein [Desulfuromonadales bacterium]|nr:carboxypeptidase-like regulatory domain-containing protein [Desulfuromonadales bacterium]